MNDDERRPLAGSGDRDQAAPSRRSLRGLDWFVFFLADVQTGFGPFVAVYLTTQKWTQAEIGLVLSIGGIVGLLGQMPGGALVDLARSERMVAGLAITAIGASALAYAMVPLFAVVVSAAGLHAAASCVLGPAIAALTLGLVGPHGMSERLGRNARFAALGNGTAAAVMGTIGYLLSSGAVFLVTCVLVIPALVALSHIREEDVDAARAHGAVRGRAVSPVIAGILKLLRQRGMVVFVAGIFALQLANAAMLPLMAGIVTTRSSAFAPMLIAACIIVPQAIVALLSPSVGALAQAFGRRPLLLAGLAALAARGLLFAVVADPFLLVVVQVLDGITAAVFGVMVPLTVADLAFGSGHFNLAQGVVGTATGIGASLSTVIAGLLSDRFGPTAAFLELAAVASVGLLVIALLMPETRPSPSRIRPG